jgi:hypothetical protein
MSAAATASPPRHGTTRAAAWLSDWTAAWRQAAQWRLGLLWLLANALPLFMLALPLWRALAGPLDHSLLASRLVEGFDPAVLADALGSLRQRGYSPLASIGALLLFALTLPWLTGVVTTAARAPMPLPLLALASGGLANYGRMARLWLWALVPLGLALGAGLAASHVAREQALTMTLQADADLLGRAAAALGVLLFVLAHATVDAARAQLVLEPHRRSVVLAWWRALTRLVRRPGRIALYIAITVTGLFAAAVLSVLRVQVPPVGAAGLLGGIVLGQALVLVLAWMRCARLFALVRSGRA